jgi:hypothetical protein
MSQLFSFLKIFILLSLFFPNNAMAQGWTRTLPCGDPNTIGWAGNDPVGNVIRTTVSKWSPNLKYFFYGKLAWDKRQGTTRGDILLKRGDVVIATIDKWVDPPGQAEIRKDITQYITGNGTYSIDWRYTGGASGICIMKSEIVSSE